MKRFSIFFRTLAVAAMLLSVACGSQQPTIDYDKLTYPQLIEQAPAEQVQAWYDCASRIDEDEVAARGAEIKAQKKLLCFDLDGTLTNHKTPLTPENRVVLDKLMANPKYKVIMVGAGNARRIYNQMGEYPIDIVANYGMQEATVIDGVFTEIRNDQRQVDRDFFIKNSEIVRQRYGFTEYAGESIEFHPAGMVTLGLLGTEAKTEDKLVFDPDKAKRRAIYKDVCELFKGYAVFIGGSTSFDFTEMQYNKYDAVMNYAHRNGFTRDEILFIGDDFGDGGGDSHIRLGGMDYIHITDFTKLPERMEFLY
jgi:HAD superfamily hydrolase (TIGR01484 family)